MKLEWYVVLNVEGEFMHFRVRHKITGAESINNLNSKKPN